MRDKLTEQIEALIMPYIEELSAELVELNVKHRGKTVMIEVVADRPGGITIGECTLMNKKADREIENKQWFGEDYVIEVSSPGLDRPLKTSADFSRAIGREVRFHLLEAVEGKVEHLGVVLEVKKEEILVNTNDKTITVPLETISKAVQVIK